MKPPKKITLVSDRNVERVLNELFEDLYNRVIERGVHISDPTGGAVIDAEARAAINAILLRLEEKNINAGG